MSANSLRLCRNKHSDSEVYLAPGSMGIQVELAGFIRPILCTTAGASGVLSRTSCLQPCSIPAHSANYSSVRLGRSVIICNYMMLPPKLEFPSLFKSLLLLLVYPACGFQYSKISLKLHTTKIHHARVSLRRHS